MHNWGRWRLRTSYGACGRQRSNTLTRVHSPESDFPFTSLIGHHQVAVYSFISRSHQFGDGTLDVCAFLTGTFCIIPFRHPIPHQPHSPPPLKIVRQLDVLTLRITIHDNQCTIPSPSVCEQPQTNPCPCVIYHKAIILFDCSLSSQACESEFQELGSPASGRY